MHHRWRVRHVWTEIEAYIRLLFVFLPPINLHVFLCVIWQSNECVWVLNKTSEISKKKKKDHLVRLEILMGMFYHLKKRITRSLSCVTNVWCHNALALISECKCWERNRRWLCRSVWTQLYDTEWEVNTLIKVCTTAAHTRRLSSILENGEEIQWPRDLLWCPDLQGLPSLDVAI